MCDLSCSRDLTSLEIPRLREIFHRKVQHGLELAYEKVYITANGRTGDVGLARSAELHVSPP